MQYIAQMSLVPKQIIEQLKLMHKKFLWKNDSPKIKHSTLIADYSDGGLKDVDIDANLKALKLTWIRKLCDDSGHPWKIIPLAYLKLQNNEAIWHRNLCIDQKLLNKINGIPKFYVKLLTHWADFAKVDSSHLNPYVYLGESLWFNSFIQISNQSAFYEIFSMRGINILKDLYNNDGKLLSFNELTEKGILRNMYFRWIQLIEAIPSQWKSTIKDHFTREEYNPQNIVAKHDCITHKSIMSIPSLTCKSIYTKFVKKLSTPPTSIRYFTEKLELEEQFDWKLVFLTPRKVTIESQMRIFQYKILNNVLYLNKLLYKMKIVKSPLCYFCREQNQTPIHLFCKCKVTLDYWSNLQAWLRSILNLPDLIPQSALLGKLDFDTTGTSTRSILVSHIILIFKKSLYEMRFRNCPPSVHYIKIRIAKTRKIEFSISKNSNKLEFHLKKWDIISSLLDPLTSKITYP